MLLKGTVTLGVIYYMPDHKSLLNEFWWQHTDIIPELPRTHKFLLYWKENIDAIIKEVYVNHSYIHKQKMVDWEFNIC